MGGTGWSYVAPYQEDIEKALQELSQDVFAREDYERPLDALDGLNDLEGAGFFSADEQERQEITVQYSVEALNVLIERVGLDNLRTELRSLTDAPTLSSLDDLRALQCLSAEGTSSILDMDRIALEPASGTIVPVPPEELVRLFGTDKPSRQVVEDAEYSGKPNTGPTWQGVYLVAYDGGKPTTIHFIGSSGD